MGYKQNTKTNHISLAEAIKYCEYSQEYLSLLARRGVLPAIKLGRNWFITREDILRYTRKIAIKKGEIQPQSILLAEAAKEFGSSQEYLSLLARKGTIPAVKVGRVWFTTREDVEDYFRRVSLQKEPIAREEEVSLGRVSESDIQYLLQLKQEIYLRRPVLRSILLSTLGLIIVILNIFVITDGVLAQKGGGFKNGMVQIGSAISQGTKNTIEDAQGLNIFFASQGGVLAQNLENTNQKASQIFQEQMVKGVQKKTTAIIVKVKNTPAKVTSFTEKTDRGAHNLVQKLAKSGGAKNVAVQESVHSLKPEGREAGASFKKWVEHGALRLKEEIVQYKEEQGQKIEELPQKIDEIAHNLGAELENAQNIDYKEKVVERGADIIENASKSKKNFLEKTSSFWASRIANAPQALESAGISLLNTPPLIIENATVLAEQAHKKVFAWPGAAAETGESTWSNLVAMKDQIVNLPAILQEARVRFYERADRKTKTAILGTSISLEETKEQGQDLLQKTQETAKGKIQNKGQRATLSLGLAWSRATLKFNQGLSASMSLAGEAANNTLSLLQTSGEQVLDVGARLKKDYDDTIQGFSNLYLVYDQGAVPNAYTVLGRSPGEAPGSLSLNSNQEAETKPVAKNELAEDRESFASSSDNIPHQKPESGPEKELQNKEENPPVVAGDTAPSTLPYLTLQYVTTQGASTTQNLTLRGVLFHSGVKIGELAELSRSLDVKERLMVGTIATFQGDIIAHKSLTLDKDLLVQGKSEFEGDLTVGSQDFHVDTLDHNVGIGTLYPKEKLDVAGNLKVEKALLVVEEAHLFDNLMVDGWTKLTGVLEANGGIYIDDDKFIVNGKTGDVETAGTLRVHQDAWFNRDMFITSGNVGVGTANPTARLQVVGDEVRIGDSGTINYATGDGDLYVEDVLEVDGTIYGNVIGTITPPGFTQGSVVFINAAGALAEDNANFYWDDTNNRLGIGTTAPAYRLAVQADGSNPAFVILDSDGSAGSIQMRAGGSGLRNIFIGTDVGKNNLSTNSSTGRKNTALGYQSLAANTIGYGNTAMGYQSLNDNLDGMQNTAFGQYAMRDNISGYSNTAVGHSAMAYSTAGNLNTAIGEEALSYLNTGSYNTAVGAQTLYSNTSGRHNTALGSGALLYNDTGNYNIATGRAALELNISGSNNTANGYYALYGNTIGSYNTGFGGGVLYFQATGSNNTAVGQDAGYGVNGVSAFSNSTLMGYQAGYGLTTGSNNILFGYKAGDNITSGANNIIIGYDIDAASITGSNQLNIGNAIYGDLSLGYVGIGTTTPDSILEVYGSSNKLRLSYNDTYYTDLSTGSSGDLTINPTGGNVLFADTRTLAIGGAVGQAYNAIGDTTTAMSHSLASDDDLYIEGDLEVDGAAWFDTGVTVAGVMTAYSVKLYDTNQSNLLNLVWNENDTANRVLNLLVAGGNRSLTLNENLTIGDGNGGTITFSGASKTLTIEDNSIVNQDLTTDANPTFAGVNADAINIGITAASEIDTDSGNLTLDSASGTVLVDDQLRLALSLYAPTGTFAFGGADTKAYNAIGDTTTAMSHSLASDDDLYIEGDLEVDGSAWFDTGVTVAGVMTAYSVKLYDTNQSNLLNLVWNENDTANRVLNLLVAGGNRSLTLNENLTIGDGYNITLTALGQDDILAMNESLTIGDGNGGTITFSGASKTLTIEDNSIVNQDLTTDANPTFAGVNADAINIGITAASEIDTDSGNLTLDSASGTVLVDDQLRLALSLYAPTGTFAFGGADTKAYNAIGDTTTAMSHSLASDDDLYIEGDLEVDGSAWFDASVTVAGTITVGASKFSVDTNGDIVKLKNLPYSWPSAHTTNGVLVNGGTGTLTWSTVGAVNITDDSLDFAQFEDTLNLDATTTVNQTTYRWIQSYTGTSGAGLTYTASGAITSGNAALDFNVSNASTSIPAMMITNSGSSYALRVNDDGTAGDTTPFVIASDGNVGIGTTNPAQKLHVEGQCVTGDTVLPILKSEENFQFSIFNFQSISNDLIFKQIKDIKAGEYVLSLNEKTGQLEPAKIKGLLDMGVKPIYKLTTEDGRTIRTTGNHPYLVQTSTLPSEKIFHLPDSKTTNAPAKSLAGNADNNLVKEETRALASCWGIRNQTTEKTADLGHWQKSASLVTKTRRSLSESEARTLSCDPCGSFFTSSFCPERKAESSERTFSSSRNFGLGIDDDIVFSGDGRSVTESGGDMFSFERRKGFQDVSLGFSCREHFQDLPNHHARSFEDRLAVADSGISDDIIVDGDFHQDEINNNDGANNYTKEDSSLSNNNALLNTEWTPLDNKQDSEEDSEVDSQIKEQRLNSENSNYLTGWTKVIDLSVGDEIAVANENLEGIHFVKIAKIEILPAEQVYDIEVEGTHNFVANGILAHNTYLSGSIAIGGATGQAYNAIGDTTTAMSHSLASDDDLYIEGDLEVDGSAWFDASVTVAGTITAGASKFTVDTNGDIVKLKNLTYSWPSSPTANGVLTNTDGSGTLTWATVGAVNITDDSLDFAQFQDTLDLDATTTVNQTTYRWIQSYTGTSGAGLTYNATGAITSGNAALDFNVSNASTSIPAVMITNSGSSYALRVNDDGTTGDTTPFVINASGNVGIGTAAPGAALAVGNNVFKVSSAGAVTAATGITSSDNITFSGLTIQGPVIAGAGGLLSSEAQLAIARGGTNGTAAPTAGAIAYGTGSAYAFNSAGSTGQALLSGGTTAPTWTTGTLSLASNFALSGTGGLTLSIGGATTATIPTGTITLADLSTTQTFSGTKTFDDINIADTGISLSGATTTFTATGALTLTAGGALALNAGGSNQNIILTPSGTGYTILIGIVGVGTTGPGTKLHVYNSTSDVDSEIRVDGTGLMKSIIGLANDGIDYGQLYFNNITKDVIIESIYGNLELKTDTIGKSIELQSVVESGSNFITPMGGFGNQVSNYVLYSEVFSTGNWYSAWTGTMTKTDNAAIAPDGTLTAAKIVATGADTGIMAYSQYTPRVAGDVYVFSIWVRSDIAHTGSIWLRKDNIWIHSLSIAIGTEWKRFTMSTILNADSTYVIGAIRPGAIYPTYVWGGQITRSASVTGTDNSGTDNKTTKLIDTTKNFIASGIDIGGLAEVAPTTSIAMGKVTSINSTISFDTGTGTQPAVGATITGGTSTATGTVVEVVITSGTFAGGDAAGYIEINTIMGTFQAETITWTGGSVNATAYYLNDVLVFSGGLSIGYGAKTDVDNGDTYYVCNSKAVAPKPYMKTIGSAVVGSTASALSAINIYASGIMSAQTGYTRKITVVDPLAYHPTIYPGTELAIFNPTAALSPVLSTTGVLAGHITEVKNISATYALWMVGPSISLGPGETGKFLYTGSAWVTMGIGQTYLQKASNVSFNVITTTGNVGIGTAGPTAKLQINPTVTATADTRMLQSGIVYNGATAMANWYGGYIAAPTGTGTITNKYALVTEANAGNVGIGTAAPGAALAVGNNVFKVSSAGAITAATGITSSDDITFSGLTIQGPVIAGVGGLLSSEAQLAIARGGTNGTAAPTAGAIAYGTGSAYAFNSAGSTGQALLSGGTTAPTWTIGTLSLASNFALSGTGGLTLSIGGATTATIPTGTITLADLSTTQTFSGTKTFNDIDIADTGISLSGATTTFTATGALTLTAGGALALNAGGSNQNIILTPSGTGYTILNGNVGVGTTSPQALLDTAGVIRSTDSAGVPPNGTGGAGLEFYYASGAATGYILSFDRTGGEYKKLELEGSTLILNDGSAGNVGIGTIAPDKKLEINTGASDNGLRISYNDSNGSATDYTDVITGADGDLTITTVDSDGALGHIALMPDGNVGIGTATPGRKLTISETETSVGNYYLAEISRNGGAASSSAKGTGLLFSDGNSIQAGIIADRVNSVANYYNDLVFLVNAGSSSLTPNTALTTAMTIKYNGSVGIGTTAPDKILEINGASGGTVRLTYNDTNGSAADYTDLSVDGSGGLTLAASAETVASAAGAEKTTLTIAPPTITLTGTTQVTSQMDSILMNAPTITDTSAVTVNGAATLTIAGAPIKNGSVTLTNTYGLKVNAAAVGAATNAYGLYVDAPTGATKNYAASFASGNVGIGTTNPGYKLVVSNNTANGNIYFPTQGTGQGVPTAGNTVSNGDKILFSNTVTEKIGFGAGGGGDLWVQASATSLTMPAFTIYNGVAGVSPTQRFTVLGNGNVGIGDTVPDALLDVAATQTSGIISQISYESPKTLIGNLTGLDFDLSTYVTPSTYNITGLNLELPSGASGDMTFLKLIEGSSTLYDFDVTSAQFNVPTSFNSAGDVAFSYDLIMANPSTAYIKFQGAGYIETESPYGNYDLTLLAANAGAVFVSDIFKVSDSTASTMTLFNQTGSGPILDIQKSGTSRLYIKNDGNVGIGTAAPGAKLDIGLDHTTVYSSTSLSNAVASYDILQLSNTDGTSAGDFTSLRFQELDTMGNAVARIALVNQAAANSSLAFLFRSSADTTHTLERMRITSLGSVGIGTTAPDKILEINGASGGTVRLTYNDTNGSATDYTDLSVDGSGGLTLAASAETVASAAGAEKTTLTITPPMITLTGTTQVTSQMDSILMNAPTITDASAVTVNGAATLTIAGAPIKAGSVTLTNTYGLKVNAAAVSTAANAYGLYVDAPTGATANYAAVFATGNVGIGTAAPGALLDLGTAGTKAGVIRLAGGTTGNVTVQVAAAAGTWSMTLPTAVGTAGYQLTDVAGNGITSWATATSLRSMKDIVGEALPADALTQILNTNVYRFHFKPGMGTGDNDTEYVGVMADEAPWAMHYNGTIVNPVNTLGYMVLGIQALDKKISALGISSLDLQTKLTVLDTSLSGIQTQTSSLTQDFETLKGEFPQVIAARDFEIDLAISDLGNKIDSELTDYGLRIADLETRISRYESRITELENQSEFDTGQASGETPEVLNNGASSEQADLESLQSTLQTLVDSLSNLENVSNQLNTLSASILTVMESNQVNTARIDELEKETQSLQQIVKVVEDKVIIGEVNKYLVLDAATGLEINSENFSLDQEGNIIVKGEITTKLGRINSTTGILELNPGEASDTVPEPKVVVKGDLELKGKLILGVSDSVAAEENKELEMTTGTGKIIANEAESRIANNKVTENSLIYITPTSKTGGQVLFISAKRAEEEEVDGETVPRGFTVSVENSAVEDIEFNWWIVERK